MKRILLSLFILISLQLAQGASTKIGDLYYNLNSSKLTAEVTYYSSYFNDEYVRGDIAIPELIGYGGKTYSVTSIGDKAFYNCSRLTSVTIPNSVTSIGDYAFYSCYMLTSVTIPNSVTSIGDQAFRDCSRLTSVTIPNSVTSIGDYAFSSCSGLTSVEIGNSVTSIGDYAFYNCYMLTSITIPNSVTSIGNAPFALCDKLASINVESGNNSYASIDGVLFSKNIDTLIQCPPGGLIGPYIIPQSVTSIGDYAFDGCIGLTGILKIPDSVISIGEYAFSGCTGFTELTLPNSISVINDECFHGCTGFTGPLIIPNSVQSIKYGAFMNCTGFTELILGEKVQEIQMDVFYECSGFTGTLTIPSSVTAIWPGAFYGCNGFKEIQSLSEIPPQASDGAFNGLYNKPLYVSSQSIPLYESAPEWGKFNSIGPFPVYATGISLNKSELTLLVGQEDTLTATLTPADTNTGIVWTVEDEGKSYISVNQSGKISALAAGNATVIVTSGDVSASCRVTVKDGDNIAVKPGAGTGANAGEDSGNGFINGMDVTVHVNRSVTINLEMPKDLSETPSLTWKLAEGGDAIVKIAPSSNTLSATFTGVSLGETSYTVYLNGIELISGEITVIAEVPMTSLLLEPSEITLAKNAQPQTLKTKFTPANASLPKFNWTSSQPSVATISSEGMVSPIGKGQTVITATALDGSGLTATCIVTVDDPNYNGFGFEFNGTVMGGAEGISLYIGDTYQFKPKVQSGYELPDVINWSSSDVQKVSVNDKGLVSAIALGSATITASAISNGQEFKAECLVTVIPVPAQTVKISKDNIKLIVGETEKLTATVYPENTTNPVIQWQSANEEIAKVDAVGTVTAVSVGNVSISASCGGARATCEVRVDPAPGKVIIDGIYYDYNGNNAFVVGCASNVEEAVIAEKITVTFGDENIEYDVVGIAGEAFANYSQLHSVVIPSSVTTIGENAFANCKQLSSISCSGSTPPSCPANAFTNTNCRLLLVEENSVSAYSNAKTWKDFEFILGVFGKTDNVGIETVDNLTYLFIDGEASVIPSEHYTSLSSVQIPEQISVKTLAGLPVVCTVNKISRNAFYNCQTVSQMNIPSTITNIEANAFANCTGLLTVNCYATNPPACASNAFTGSKCEDLHVPYHSLSSYQDAIVWKNFKNIYGDLDLYEYNKMYFWLDPQSQQGELVSVDKSIDKVDIPQELLFGGITYPIVTIAEGAFKECENISTITIPSSISLINAKIFEELKNLKNLTFYDGSQLLYINGTINASSLEILTIGRELYFGETSIDGNKINCNPVFAKYTALTSLNFGKNIKTIVKGMFEGCSNLRSITIPENVEFIGDKAFNGCVSLRSINLEDASNPITIESATSGAGTGTTFGSAPIETIYLGRNVEYIGTELSPFKNLETLTTLTIGNKTTSINNYLFYGCRNIEMMSVPSSVTYIGGYSFYDCSKAKLLTISRSVETIGEYAFYNCRSLSTLNIPSSVETIGDYAFRSCSGLTSISIGDGVKTIGNYAFLDCYMASKITIGNSVQTIGENAFYNCQSWANIIIPNSVVTIGANAFALCQGANEITIGVGVKSIGERAFADCDFITKVSSLSSVPPVAFDNSFTSYDAILYVPQNALNSYRTSTCWKNFKTIVNDLPAEIPATGITITPSGSTELKVGESLQLTATVSPENATNKTVTWESSDSSVATVNQQGVVTAIAPGTTVIIASDAYGHNAMVTVSVKADDTPVEIPATGISITPSAPSQIKVGESIQLTATVSPENATNKTVTWDSSDSRVASVDQDGLVKGLSEGTAVITATDAYGHNAFAIITVVANDENGVEAIFDDFRNLHIFTVNGILIKKDATPEDIENLTPGIYIIGGKKILIK